MKIKLEIIVLAAAVAAVMLTAIVLSEDSADADVWSGNANYDWYNPGDDTFEITTAAQLKGFANLSNGADGKTATNFDAKTVRLTANIDLAGLAWTPIGSSVKSFAGVFDGTDHKITRMNIVAGEGGLFDYVSSKGKVLNIEIGHGCTLSANTHGVIVGSNYGTVENCRISGNITCTGDESVGGVVGRNHGIVRGCYNTGDISGFGSKGTLCGVTSYNIHIMEGCYNTGKIFANGDYGKVAGVVGQNDGTLQDCYNTGIVATGTAGKFAGGIVGLNTGNLKDCYNTGDVTSLLELGYAGGIAYRNEGTISECRNVGCIKAGDGSYAGGVAGDNPGTVRNCCNTGMVYTLWTKGCAGGIAGNNGGSVQNCYNIGNIKTVENDGRTGGIVGNNGGSVQNCYNTGSTTGGKYSKNGGIVGYAKTESTLKWCYWLSASHDSVKCVGNSADFKTPTDCAYFRNFNDSMYTYNGTVANGPSKVHIAAALNANLSGGWLRWTAETMGYPVLPAEYPRLVYVFSVKYRLDGNYGAPEMYETGTVVTVKDKPTVAGCNVTDWKTGDAMITNGKFTITRNVTLTAFSIPVAEPPKAFTVTVTPSPASGGKVSGGGGYQKGDEAKLMALPEPGFGLLKWDDGDINVIRKVIVSADAEYVAIFSKMVAVSFDHETPLPNNVLAGQEITLSPSTAEGGGWMINGEYYAPGEIFSVPEVDEIHVAASERPGNTQSGDQTLLLIAVGAIIAVAAAGAAVFFLRRKV